MLKSCATLRDDNGGDYLEAKATTENLSCAQNDDSRPPKQSLDRKPDKQPGPNLRSEDKTPGAKATVRGAGVMPRRPKAKASGYQPWPS